MSRRYVIVLLTLVAVACLTPPAAGQTQTTADDWKPPRTPDGQPDLQGVWSYATLTPLERPSEYASREFLTDEEVAERNEDGATFASSERRDELVAQQDVDRAYDQFWWDRGTSDGRTALIEDPPDGRIPYTRQGRQRVEARRALSNRAAHGPEDRSPAERCVHHPKAGPPLTPGGYNNNVQVFQIPGYVVMFTEQIHDARIIPLDGHPDLSPNVRQWMGSSRGHWEGATLVVDTTNFNGRMSYQGSTEHLHLVERFTRVDADTIEYTFTVDDPASYTRPWTASIQLRPLQGEIYEFACHEGNYGMFNLLAGARAEEKDAEAAAR